MIEFGFEMNNRITKIISAVQNSGFFDKYDFDFIYYAKCNYNKYQLFMIWKIISVLRKQAVSLQQAFSGLRMLVAALQQAFSGLRKSAVILQQAFSGSRMLAVALQLVFSGLRRIAGVISNFSSPYFRKIKLPV